MKFQNHMKARTSKAKNYMAITCKKERVEIKPYTLFHQGNEQLKALSWEGDNAKEDR